MYTYPELFIGIPLSQFDEQITPVKSKKLIEELSNYVQEELSINRIEDFLEDVDGLENTSDDLKEIFKRLIDFRDGNILSEFKDLLKDYKIDFKSNYHGGDEKPLIFGFYISELMAVPATGLSEFSEDINKIYILKDRMKIFCQNIFGEKHFSDLQDDKLIGVFWNNHSS